MSLLMDALKRAEETKRLAEQQKAETPPQAPHQDILPARVTSALPDLSLHSDAVDADLKATHLRQQEPPAFSTRSAGAGQSDDARNAARNLFTAKESPRQRGMPWLLLAAAGIAALAIVAYFWWQLHGIGSPSLAPPPPRAGSVPLQTAAGLAPPVQAAAPRPSEPAASPSATQPPAEHPILFPSPAAAPTARNRPAPPPAEKSALPTAEDSPIRVNRQPAKTDPTLAGAYAALIGGRSADAARDYERVLRADPRNVDALLGMATIAAQQDQVETARAYYLRALESDPNNPTAQAGVISSRSRHDTDFSESRLKTAIAAQPDAPSLHFALANLYAREARWSEAQQAYFRAYTLAPTNPDFIFNLAVSLDHLNQSRLAAQHYKLALDAARTQAHSFDRAQAENRLVELQP